MGQLRGLTNFAIALGGALYFILGILGKTTKRGRKGSSLRTDAFRPLPGHHAKKGSS
jgi:hypothetical protein